MTFSNLESQVDKIKLIFGHLLSSLIQGLQTNLENFSHRFRVILHDPSLSFPIHIHFQDHDDFTIDLVINEMDRVLNSNEGFDICIRIRLNILSVSLPALQGGGGGGKDNGGKNNRTIPNLLTFMQQKSSAVRIIETDDNNCLITTLGIGHERILEAAQEAPKLNISLP